MSQMRSEIQEQPKVVAALTRRGTLPYRDLVRTLKASHIRFVLYVARGTSDNAAVYGQYLASTLAGLPSGLALPSASTLYRSQLTLEQSLVVGISQSGETPDVAEAVAAARAQGALTVAITNNPKSPLAQAAAWTLETRAGTEKAVAATKTYTAQLAVLALFWSTWAGDRFLLDSLAREVPPALEISLSTEGAMAALADQLVPSPKLLLVARGYNLATALETSLKIQETSGIPSLAYSGADLLHGPIAMLGRGVTVLCFNVPGPTEASMTDLTGTLRSRGARVVSLSSVPRQLPASQSGRDTGGAAGGEIDTVALPSLPDPLSPIVNIVPGQLLAYHLATRAGRDPDRPAGLSKVTLAR